LLGFPLGVCEGFLLGFLLGYCEGFLLGGFLLGVCEGLLLNILDLVFDNKQKTIWLNCLCEKAE